MEFQLRSHTFIFSFPHKGCQGFLFSISLVFLNSFTLLTKVWRGRVHHLWCNVEKHVSCLMSSTSSIYTECVCWCVSECVCVCVCLYLRLSRFLVMIQPFCPWRWGLALQSLCSSLTKATVTQIVCLCCLYTVCVCVWGSETAWDSRKHERSQKDSEIRFEEDELVPGYRANQAARLVIYSSAKRRSNICWASCLPENELIMHHSLARKHFEMWVSLLYSIIWPVWLLRKWKLNIYPCGGTTQMCLESGSCWCSPLHQDRARREGAGGFS